MKKEKILEIIKFYFYIDIHQMAYILIEIRLLCVCFLLTFFSLSFFPNQKLSIAINDIHQGQKKGVSDQEKIETDKAESEIL